MRLLMVPDLLLSFLWMFYIDTLVSRCDLHD
jgi:hypothetical protein